MIKGTIKGLQEALAANNKLLAEMKPSGTAGKVIQFGTAAAQRASIQGTPVDTGAWRASNRTKLNSGRLQGTVFLDPSARNPRSGTPVQQYASVWDARGGQRAVYARVVSNDGQQIMSGMAAMLIKGLPS